MSEKIWKSIKKTLVDSFGSYSRGLGVAIFSFLAGGLAGLVIVANTFNPRVIAVESRVEELEIDFTGAYELVNLRLESLEDARLETRIQVQMLILYQIPAAEREALRGEAEKQLDSLE